MAENNQFKMVPVKPETHRLLSVLKAERGDGSFDETVRALLDQPTFTQDELKLISDMLGCVDDSSNDPTLYHECRDTAQKAYGAWMRGEEKK